MEREISTDFKLLITLPQWKTEMLKSELSKRSIPVKTKMYGSGASASAHGGKGLLSQDTYVPENRLQESKEILSQLEWAKSEIQTIKKPTLLKTYAFIVLFALMAYLIYLVKVFLSDL